MIGIMPSTDSMDCSKPGRKSQKFPVQLLVCPMASPAACGEDAVLPREHMEAAAHGGGACAIFTSIADAVEASIDGDIVRVFPGIYEEALVITKAITLCAAVPVDERSQEDSAVVIKHDGGSTLTSTAQGARIRGLNFVHTGGNTAGRGRQGPRCLEVCDGFLTVDNCTFSSLAGSAVMVVGPGSALLRRTGLVNSGRCGLICVHAGNAECVGCNLSGNALNGTDVQSGGCVSMRESIVRRNNQTGVLVADVDSFVHINGCDISSNMRRGVTAQKSGSFVLENSTVLRNHNIGVIGIGPWEEQVEPLQIRNNRIADNLSTGLWLQRGNANIEGNTICGNGDSGLVAFGPTSIVTIKDGTICNNKGTGISVHSTQHISVTGCFIGATRRVLDEDSRTAVMMAMHPRLGRESILRAIDDAVCSEVFSAWSFDEPMGNMGTGIELRGTSAIISGNKIAHSGDVGVMVGEKCCIELVSNTIEGNVCGVKIKGQGAKCLSRSNVCERSTEVGVEVSAGGCWLSPGGDRIRLSGGWGLSVEDGAASVHARDVLVDNNLGGGVLVAAGGTTVEMSECVISRNRGDAVLVQGTLAMHGGTVSGHLSNGRGLVVEEGGSCVTLTAQPPIPELPGSPTVACDASSVTAAVH